MYFKNENYCLCTGGLLITSLKFCDKIFMSSDLHDCVNVKIFACHMNMHRLLQGCCNLVLLYNVHIHIHCMYFVSCSGGTHLQMKTREPHLCLHIQSATDNQYSNDDYGERSDEYDG